MKASLRLLSDSVLQFTGLAHAPFVPIARTETSLSAALVMEQLPDPPTPAKFRAERKATFQAPQIASQP